MPTDWTEKELIKCENKEKFSSFWISQLFNSKFGKKPKISTTRSPIAVIVPAPLALSLTTPGLSALVSANISIYPIQPLVLRLILAAYMKPSDIGSRTAVYTQLLGIRHTLAVYALIANYTQSIMGFAHPVYNFLFISNLLVIITTSMDHSRKLSNLAKINTDDAKYSR